MEIAIAVWLICSFLVGIFGSSKKIGFAGAFIFSILFSPFIGLIISLIYQASHDVAFEKEIRLNLELQQKSINHLKKQNSISITQELERIQELLDNNVISKSVFEKIELYVLNKFNDLDSSNQDDVPQTTNLYMDMLSIDDQQKIDSIVYESLTEKEQKRVIAIIPHLEKGNFITKHSNSKEIKIMSINDYNRWVKFYGEKFLLIIAKYE